MDIKIRDINSYTYEMAISVPWLELEDLFEQSISQIRKKVRLPGFRKGKVPRRILIQQFGPEIEADFVEEAIQRHYIQALEEKNITPVNQPKVNDIKFNQGEPLRFTATLEVEPDVTLPKYRKKLKVKKNIYIPDDQDVDDYIEELRRQHAELRTNETGSEDRSLLFVDMQELDRSGVPIIGRKVEDRYIKVGEGVFGGENLKRLTGLKLGDTAIIEVPTRTDDGHTKYEITVKNVQEEIFPELSEDFIKKVDESATNESELRENVMKIIQERLNRDAEAQIDDAIVDYFLQNTTIEVPPSMVENYIENSLKNAKSGNGKPLDEGAYRERIRPSVIRNLKWYLVRKVLLGAEDLDVSDDEVEGRIKLIVKRAGENSSRVQRFYRKKTNRERLRDDLLDNALFDKLKSYAKLNEVKIPTKELRKQQRQTVNPVN